MEEILFGKRLIRMKWHLPKYIVLNSFLIFSAWQPFNEMTFEHTEYLLWVSFSCWCVLSQKHCVLVFSVSGMVRQWQCVRLKTRFLSKWESHKPTPAGSHHYCRTAHIKQIIIIIIISSPRIFLLQQNQLIELIMLVEIIIPLFEGGWGGQFFLFRIKYILEVLSN